MTVLNKLNQRFRQKRPLSSAAPKIKQQANAGGSATYTAPKSGLSKNMRQTSLSFKNVSNEEKISPSLPSNAGEEVAVNKRITRKRMGTSKRVIVQNTCLGEKAPNSIEGTSLVSSGSKVKEQGAKAALLFPQTTSFTPLLSSRNEPEPIDTSPEADNLSANLQTSEKVLKYLNQPFPPAVEQGLSSIWVKELPTFASAASVLKFQHPEPKSEQHATPQMNDNQSATQEVSSWSGSMAEGSGFVRDLSQMMNELEADKYRRSTKGTPPRAGHGEIYSSPLEKSPLQEGMARDLEEQKTPEPLEPLSITSTDPLSNPPFTQTPDADTVAQNNMAEASNLLSAASKDILELQENVKLSEEDLLLSSPRWDIPPSVVDSYAKHNILSMYPWQAECLSLDGVMTGRQNLVFSAPTSAGKTMVAEFIMLKKLVISRKKAIMILPFVSIVAEKASYLQLMFDSVHLRVCGYFANSSDYQNFDEVDIAICTIEKANSLVNRLLEEGRLAEIGIVVVDELHMIGNENRGYLLELLLTKMMVVLKDDLQIIGMSATLPNIDVLANWLKAHLYITDYRPVPLSEFVMIGDTLYDTNFNVVRRLHIEKKRIDPDYLIPICYEVTSQGNSVLIFCHSKSACESCAKFISEWLLVESSETALLKRAEIIQRLKNCPAGLDPLLDYTVQKGIAFHHAGLTVEEREIIEDGYRAGIINVLTATCTLASGVNLPARRVIFRSPKIGTVFLDAQNYKQMKGRAGRKGKDTLGESIILCKDYEIARVKKLVQAELQPVKSCLREENRGMKRALLEVIAGSVVSLRDDVDHYIRCTLLYKEVESLDKVKTVANTALDFLRENEFIIEIEVDGKVSYQPTKLGTATVASALSPEEGLHVVYHVTPTYIDIQPSWQDYMRIFNSLSEVDMLVAHLVGVKGAYITRRAHGAPENDKGPEKKKMVAIHRRFFAAMILNDLVHEVPFSDLVMKYQVNRGTIQALQLTSSSFAAMITTFCQRLGWNNLAIILSQFQDRVNFGVEKELCELARIPYVKGSRARVLYSAGFRTIASLATATPEEIMTHLAKARPFKSEKTENNMAGEEFQRRIEARAARAIVNHAREMLEQQGQQLERSVKDITSRLENVKRATLIKRKRNSTDASQDHSPGAGGMLFTLRYLSTPTTQAMNGENSSPINTKLSLRSGGDVSPHTNLDCTARHALSKGDDYEIVRTAATLNLFSKFVESWAKQPVFALRLVTGLRDNAPVIEGLTVCWEVDRVYHVDILSDNFLIGTVKPILSSRSYKVIFDSKDTIKKLQTVKLEVRHNIMDPRVAAWLLSPETQEQSLQQMIKSFVPGCELPPRPGTKLDISCRESLQSLVLMDLLASRLQAENLLETFFNVEMPVISTLAQMERVGFGFDHQKLEAFQNTFSRKLDELQNEAWQYASWKSPDQVAKILYDELGLLKEAENDSTNGLGIPTATRSTTKDILVKLTHLHPLPGIIMEYRRIHSLLAKTIKPLQACKEWSQTFDMFRVHPNFDFHSVTGRINTNDPNLQNTPHQIDFTELSGPNKSKKKQVVLNVRDAFIAAEGNELLSVDFCQIELRIIAHMSKDPILIDALCSCQDVFIKIASELHACAETDITPEQRQQAKRVCYGICYGTSAMTLAEELACSIEDAQAIVDDFFRKFERVSAFFDKVIKTCQDTGYVESVLGRRRYLKDVLSSDVNAKKRAERQAVNTTVQGSAADLMKVAMINVDRTLRKRFGAWYSWESDMRRMPHILVQAHDELVLEYPIDIAKEVQSLVRKCMQEVARLKVPLPVRLRAGKTWGSLNHIE
ncbi:uncharacterized protein VTP21DRAFT_6824 [Calcarisporiella thermophila]|uniref:uncharacterized protein n=1 Tax=Calcarisporiella thermophila TaxID=911321 RepID=UPI00374299C8